MWLHRHGTHYRDALLLATRELIGVAVCFLKVIADISQIVAASPKIKELELNPVRVGVYGALAVDCLIETPEE